ncbi:hypothetical protein Fmac_019123 [Flemingia macrophylla]|uniref:Terpene synthase metal-binding domain-containing protein n=1 Tax=Flemingia macrophylla TaxID=520843 RepID=A0ABD1M6W3_9FABA
MSLAVSALVSTQNAVSDLKRPCANFAPSIWGDILSFNMLLNLRMVESYLWSLTMCYKPEHSIGRMFTGKTYSVLTILDDTYDAYGTIQELELFTEAILRWDITLIESLPQCMKAVFDMLVELCKEIESLTTESKKSSFVVPAFKQAIFSLTKGYMVEAKWCHEGYIPTYNEYKVHAVLTAEAYNHILRDVEDCWKVINEACLKANDIPKVALDCVVNLARSFHFMYGDLIDKFTNSELLRDYINTLLVDPASPFLFPPLPFFLYKLSTLTCTLFRCSLLAPFRRCLSHHLVLSYCPNRCAIPPFYI